MREKVKLEKRKGKVIAYFAGRIYTFNSNSTMKRVRTELEGKGYIVELKG